MGKRRHEEEKLPEEDIPEDLITVLLENTSSWFILNHLGKLVLDIFNMAAHQMNAGAAASIDFSILF